VLERAAEGLSRGSFDFALICSVHTDHDPARLQFLQKHHRIHSADQLDGLLLGEGAVAWLCCAGPRAKELQVRPVARLHAPQSTNEKARFDNDESAFVAAGLTVAIRKAIANFPTSQKVGWVASDASFEMFRMHELQAALTRSQRHLGEPQVLEMANQRIGHWGAAVALWQVVHAAECWVLGCAADTRLLCLAGSDSGARLAFFVERCLE
jgi:3-oxoacyl-[acyl-carrier-protein] synthase-1